MKTFYLHIGTPKTGTKALQRFFYDNRERLKKKGLLYPDLARQGTGHHVLSHLWNKGWLEPEFMREHIARREEILGELAEISEEWEGDLLCSSELFCYTLIEREICAELLSYIPADKLTVILYLRSQDQFVQSCYNQQIVHGGYSGWGLHQDKSLETASLEELDEAFRLDYRKLVDALNENLKPARIIVRPYEKSQFAGGSIHSDFLQICDVEPDKEFFYPGGNVNPSLGVQEMEFLRFCNQLPFSQENRESISNILLMRSQIVSNKEAAFERHSSLSVETQIAICNRYREGNDYVARQYLGRTDLPLFLEPMPEPTVSSGLPNQLNSAEYREIFRLLDVRIYGFKEILLRCCHSVQLQRKIDIDQSDPGFLHFLMEAQGYAKS